MLSCTHIVIDEVQVVAWGDGCSATAFLGQTSVCLVERLVDVDEGIDDRLSVSGWLRQFREGYRDHIRSHVLWWRVRGEGGTKSIDTSLVTLMLSYV